MTTSRVMAELAIPATVRRDPRGLALVLLALGEVPTMLTMIGGAVLLGAVAGNALSGALRKTPMTLI